ncbi:fused response regulator/phosphatase [Streptomyces sp. V4-01]|uniref:Fused response regulator/phosphatase n=1 Tax=Actinacidiphila polyblastidii TaxID=3110430 RepID=A0ABU7P3R0_9ACTN|nr:fused response regulator/phosphatase [Streptomyces sp. V4-01]
MTPNPAAETAGARVLLVDDSATNRYVLGTYLRRAGHEVVEAEDGAAALELLRRPDLPELAVIDVRLPDMTGFEVCEIIKADDRTSWLPVIHVSASAITVTDRAQGLNRGADAYLTEPVAPNELVATVAAALRYARARQRAETLAGRLSALNRATLDFYHAENATDLAARAARGAGRIFGTPALVVVRTAEDGLIQLVGTDDGEARPVVTDPPERFAREVMRLQARDDAGVRLEMVPAGWLDGDDPLTGGTRALAVASARVKGTGSTAAVVLAQHELSEDDHEVLTQLAHACALSLEALRSYREEHTLALTLQRTFLPGSLPATPLADLAVRYLPASQTAEIGGDFYEALPVRGGLLLAVGDVAGHSLDAAVVMGEIRHALRAYALEGHPPDVILSHLEYLLQHVDSPMGATLCVALLDGSGTLHVANAGHLPLAIRDAGGTTRYISEHGPMLGLGLPQPPAVRIPVGPGTQLVMVTDGLLERRGGDLDKALAKMADLLTTAPDSADAACELLLAHFPPDGNDDVAMLIARLL